MKTTINTHEDACKFLGKEVRVPDESIFGKPIASMYKLFDIIEARNKEKYPDQKFDWNDWDQKKWQPWWDMEKTEINPSGFRFHDAYYDITYSYVGSRLCSFDSELCKDIATKHIDLYRDFMVIE